VAVAGVQVRLTGSYVGAPVYTCVMAMFVAHEPDLVPGTTVTVDESAELPVPEATKNRAASKFGRVPLNASASMKEDTTVSGHHETMIVVSADVESMNIAAFANQVWAAPLALTLTRVGNWP